MELRQLRYFVTLSEELHFGRAAAREHIVQSALSQQIRRLERDLAVLLVERNTHHVQLTTAGKALLVDARRILAMIDRATAAARAAAATHDATIRVGVGDATFDSMSLVLAAVREHHPFLTAIHHVESGVPDQYRMLLDGRLDIGIGRVSHAPDGVASELIRQDRLGVLMCDDHALAGRSSVAVADLADQPMLFADDIRAPEVNQFVRELCRAAGFTPRAYPGTVHSVYGARALMREYRALLCVPESCGTISGLRWRPLVEPATSYPWSLLWRAGAETAAIAAVRCCARRLGQRLRWLSPDARIPGIPA
ncbi:LysR substrate-binding domain-containing protein [Nocardia thraciensis]